MSPDPLRLFSQWFGRAQKNPGILHPDAMCLSTLDLRGFPDGRIVLLKESGPSGFVFYTNLLSAKGRSLLRNPRAALTFHWERLKRQVRIQGMVRLVSSREADAYFKTRPRLSQISSWASPQTSPLSSRSFLEKRMRSWIRRFKGKRIPRPPYWTGFRLIPSKIEFWEERPNRLHERTLFTKTGPDRWKKSLLYP